MAKSPEKPLRPATRLIHEGRDPFEHYGFVNPPVYRGSTVLFKDLDSLERSDQPYTYGRKGTPTVRALETGLCRLEGGHRTWLTPSGVSAITTALLGFLATGDHVLMVDSVYRPTRAFCDDTLKRMGVEVTYYDPLIGAGIGELMRPNTRIVYTEAPGSQTFEVQDIPAIARVAHDRGAWVMMDNTWATGLFYQPFAHGVDVSIQAGTKYVVGHADANLGIITANERASETMIKGAWALGVCPGTEETFLALRGLRTMQVRLKQHEASGLAMAHWLAGRPEVERVLHPGLESFPGHALWRRDFTGASGLFSVVLKPIGKPALRAFLDGLALFGMGWSWGGFESLVVPFDARPLRTATTWTDKGPCLRFHIGLEDVEDLKDDLVAGFARMERAG